MIVKRWPGALPLTALAGSNPERFPLLLQTLGANNQSAYDLLLIADGETSAITGAQGFNRLRRQYRHLPSTPFDPSLPFHGGWALLIGYEAAQVFEPRLSLPVDPLGFDTMVAVRCPAALCFDRQRNETLLVAEPYAAAMALPIVTAHAEVQATPSSGDISHLREAEASIFTDGVDQIREYILAGDVFQVNLSRAWDARCSVSATNLYRRLCASNAAPYAGVFQWQNHAVISSSPERLIEKRGRQIQTRPIAGTRPRGQNEADDLAMLQELIGHPKERAEHVMLIDLERNDLGRVAIPGSVTVDEMMVVESYTHVHHIVSNITATLSDDHDAIDAIAATFPGGTITGCPKIRCMEIIAELEGEGRGPYTGAMGYLSVDGQMDLNILIRSLQLAGDRLRFRTGAGIVWDSSPIAELAETRAKAKGLLRALR